jgi:hypothetical protein
MAFGNAARCNHARYWQGVRNNVHAKVFAHLINERLNGAVSDRTFIGRPTGKAARPAVETKGRDMKECQRPSPRPRRWCRRPLKAAIGPVRPVSPHISAALEPRATSAPWYLCGPQTLSRPCSAFRRSAHTRGKPATLSNRPLGSRHPERSHRSAELDARYVLRGYVTSFSLWYVSFNPVVRPNSSMECRKSNTQFKIYIFLDLSPTLELDFGPIKWPGPTVIHPFKKLRTQCRRFLRSSQ